MPPAMMQQRSLRWEVYVPCPRCSTPHPPEGNFCLHCGRPLHVEAARRASHDLLVYGYHGTSQRFLHSISATGFRTSKNREDWLGDGVYFWQDAPEHAWRWARDKYQSEAVVIGALVRLSDCMDLLDTGWWQDLAAFHATLSAAVPLPKQPPTSKAHRLDRAVINSFIEARARQGVRIRVVRAAFPEDDPVFQNSALTVSSHVQIAVRDTALIEEQWLEPSLGA